MTDKFSPNTRRDIEAAFCLLQMAAVLGVRCPPNSENGGPAAISSITAPALAREGRIRIEISGKNYRTVVILVGAHAGKSTAPHPQGALPWKTICTLTHYPLRDKTA